MAEPHVEKSIIRSHNILYEYVSWHPTIPIINFSGRAWVVILVNRCLAPCGIQMYLFKCLANFFSYCFFVAHSQDRPVIICSAYP